LNSIYGVDVNPYAVAIARFRLLLAAMRAGGVKRLDGAPAFNMNLACGDSLLHAPLRGGQQVFDWELASDDSDCDHAYKSEDLAALKDMLRPGLYHAVVANPPYITPKDQQLSRRYDHLQLARSISSYFVDVQERLGGRNDPRLVPLLACLLELIPWLKQWHNEVDAEFGERMGDYFEAFVNEEARQLGKTIPEIKAWEPPKKGAKGQRGRGAKGKTA
jgi:hypothetical protein